MRKLEICKDLSSLIRISIDFWLLSECYWLATFLKVIFNLWTIFILLLMMRWLSGL